MQENVGNCRWSCLLTPSWWLVHGLWETPYHYVYVCCCRMPAIFWWTEAISTSHGAGNQGCVQYQLTAALMAGLTVYVNSTREIMCLQFEKHHVILMAIPVAFLDRHWHYGNREWSTSLELSTCTHACTRVCTHTHTRTSLVATGNKKLMIGNIAMVWVSFLN